MSERLLLLSRLLCATGSLNLALQALELFSIFGSLVFQFRFDFRIGLYLRLLEVEEVTIAVTIEIFRINLQSLHHMLEALHYLIAHPCGVARFPFLHRFEPRWLRA